MRIGIVFFGLCFFVDQVRAFEYLSYKEKAHEIQQFLDPDFKDYQSLTSAYRNEVREDYWTWVYPIHFIRDENWGFRHRPHSLSREIMLDHDGEVIFDSIMTIDHYSRRVSSHPDKRLAKRFVLLSGCSFTFGQGLQDNQTVASFINEIDPTYRAFNYGIQATTINTALARLEDLVPEELEGLEQGDLLYIHIPQHIERLVGTWPSFEWMRDTPYYRLTETGEILERTSFYQARPWRRWYLELVKRLSWLLPQNRIYPYVNSRDRDYFCRMVKAMRNVWQEKFPEGRFVFVFHPFAEDREETKQCLEQAGIDYFDQRFAELTWHDGVIKNDGHPNERANREFAEMILNYLEKKRASVVKPEAP